MWILWIIFGLLFGSTANALIDRLPRNISWTKGRSKCDSCGHQLHLADLIPVLSYLFLKGKCRYCQSPIPARNLLVELTMALGFVLLNNWLLAAIWFITVTIAVMDWETQLVSDVLVIIWASLVTIYQFSIINFQFLNPISGLLVGAGVIGGLWLVTRGRGMGSGDIGLAAVMGLWLGWPNVWYGLLVAFVAGAIYGLVLIATKQAKLKSAIAFGPFIILAAWAVHLYGQY
jgi:leader peptidase (prepilin peptidase) / N-methyltransferase